MTKPAKSSMIEVNRRAAIARVKRALKQKGQLLHLDRRQWKSRFAVIDAAKGVVVATDVNLEKLARELGVLERWETIAAMGEPG